MIDPDGSCRPVEKLVVGDNVFDPLAQKQVEISNIVPWLAGSDPSTAPVHLPKHCLNSSQPSEDFFAPQTLEVFVARTPEGQKLPVAQRLLTRELVEEGTASIASQLAGLQCFLILTAAPALIMANGVLAVTKSAPQQKTA